MLIQTGSGTKNGSGAEGRQAQEQANVDANQQREVQRMGSMHISNADSIAGHGAPSPGPYPRVFKLILVQVCQILYD